jgi:menaquinone-specific isochorismate synthase
VSAPLPAQQLAARTVPLDAAGLDLVALAGDDGLLFAKDGAGFAARGCAAVVHADAALDVLASVAVDDEVGGPGTGPVAIGALPFDPAGAATLTIPEVVVGIGDDGRAWLTTIGVGAAPRLTLDALAPPALAPSPDGFTLTSGQSHEEWCAMIAEAVEAIRGGRFEKVVLAREVVVEANRPLVPTAVLARLRALYPSCMLFNVGGFLGASPELLVSRRGSAVRSHPLAGTLPHSGDPDVDARAAAGLMGSAKERHEHQVVVDAVASALGEVCVDGSVDVPEAPSIVHLRNVIHLGTRIVGVLRAPAPDVYSLVRRLHPTPAVGGNPLAQALEYIASAEPFDRGLYAGAVGWMDARGDGDWAVGIRCAQVSGQVARLVAGVGVVADSVPEAELAETQLKLQALLAAVVRP